ncbi:MAG: UbiA family prenyltransferase [Gemmataceae bacterium]|nr:UbiA family prenyltransferase [Gemmataceae bacterium]
MTRLLTFARLVRLPNVFTATADVSVGLLAGQIGGPTAFAILGASACLYASGIVWNDYFDRKIDAVERPGRPIPSGAVSAQLARMLAIVLMISGLALAWFVSPATGWHSVALAMLILGYNAGLKSTTLGPMAMGGCRAVNVLLGFATTSVNWSLEIASATIVGIYIVGITVFARDEAGLSRRSRLTFGAAVVLTSILAAAVVPTHGSAHLYLLAALFAFLSSRAVFAWQNPHSGPVQRFVKAGILGLIVLDSALAVALAGPIGLAVLVWLLPAFALGRWVYST